METNKKYVSFLGYDYTQYVLSEEDVKDFEELCRLEEACKGVPMKECVHDVAACLNLDRKLRAKAHSRRPGLVSVQPDIKQN